MPKFKFISSRIFTLSILFLVPIMAAIAINLRSVAAPETEIAQRITSPGLTTPIGAPSPPPIPIPISTPTPNPSESALPIPVPPAQKSTT
ncbi:MAG: hypothetical protein HC778_03975 [Chamaesiphon sp. CSU_1_12]|nr:hypothetical protein [Chamaesiphon sp. CSU_1_12]